MKCLQCGTELDRLSKWRGPSEYCSEECKKASQDEFNRLAMSRLMQPRPAKANARTPAGAVRTVESGTGRLTVVTHPVGASRPILTEPPEAGFIMEAAAALADLQLRHQPPVNPRPLEPYIPSSAIPMGNALLALEALLSGIRPRPRGARKLNRPSLGAFLQSAAAPPAFALPACEPVWAASLGLTFTVSGIDRGSTTVAQAEKPGFAAVTPIAHVNIPSRRPARPLPSSATSFEIGEDRLLEPPVVSPPRLRLHLPKPALNALRPRYAFAPKPPAEDASKQPVECGLEKEEEVLAVPKRIEVEKAAQSGAIRTLPFQRPNANRQHGDAAHGQDRHKNRGSKQGRPFTGVRKPLAPESQPEPAIEVKRAKPIPEPAPNRHEEFEKDTPIEKAVFEQPAPVQSFPVPSFAGESDAAPDGFWSRTPGWQKAAAALVAIGIAVSAWAIPAIKTHNARLVTLPSGAPAAPSSVGAESWETASAGDTVGIARHRIISHYKPAQTKQDYIFEFSGVIEQRAMAWVFRMKDARNYYCLKLEKKGEGAAATAQLVKFAVIDGREQPRRLVELRDPLQAGAPIKIRLDVRGQSFSTRVNGKHVDVWIDSQLVSGTLGFSNESGERAVISGVKVSY
jgi:hypothetical protein